MFSYCGNNPVNYQDVDGSSWKEIFRAIPHANNSIAVEWDIDTAAICAFLLDMQKDDKGVYHADFDCWQQYFGYNDLYDFFFDLGTSCKSKKFPFPYNGQWYILWAWKGDYINLGAGAEMGIYTGGGPHWLVDKSLAMSMHLNLQYNGITIVSYNDYTWWITGFNPYYLNVDVDSLKATFSIRFSNRDMYMAFRELWNQPDSGWTFGSRQGFGIACFSF